MDTRSGTALAPLTGAKLLSNYTITGGVLIGIALLMATPLWWPSFYLWLYP